LCVALHIAIVVNNISKIIELIFTKLSALVHFGTKMNASSFGVKRSKFKVMVGPACWKMDLFALLTQYLEKYWTEFHQTLVLMHFGTRMNASIFASKVSE